MDEVKSSAKHAHDGNNSADGAEEADDRKAAPSGAVSSNPRVASASSNQEAQQEQPSHGNMPYKKDGRIFVARNSLNEQELIQEKAQARAALEQKTGAGQMPTQADRARERRTANRLSSFQSRKRRKDIISGLESVVQELHKSNTQKDTLIRQQQEQLEQLRQEKDRLQKLANEQALEIQGLLLKQTNHRSQESVAAVAAVGTEWPRAPSQGLQGTSSIGDSSLLGLLLSSNRNQQQQSSITPSPTVSEASLPPGNTAPGGVGQILAMLRRAQQEQEQVAPRPAVRANTDLERLLALLQSQKQQQQQASSSSSLLHYNNNNALPQLLLYAGPGALPPAVPLSSSSAAAVAEVGNSNCAGSMSVDQLLAYLRSSQQQQQHQQAAPGNR